MTNGNDTIFPAPTGLNYTSGLTVREYFAAMAMQGLMANPERYKYVTKKFEKGEWSHAEATQHNAEKAVYIADALIAALNKEAANA